MTHTLKEQNVTKINNNFDILHIIMKKITIFEQQICYIKMSALKSLGTQAMRVNQAAESLAKTDDMLAILGIIMLLGVGISAYGSFWQGRLAAAQFKGQCSAEQQQQIEDKKTTRFMIVSVIIGITVIGLIIYILKKRVAKGVAA